MKRRLNIEQLLHWTYRDELPKLGADYGGSGATAPGFSGVARSGSNFLYEPGFPAAMGEPHPDALAIARFVDALEPMAIDGASSRDWLAPECAAMIAPDDPVLSNLIVDVKHYVMMHARMGTRPTWLVGRWSVERLIGRNGKVCVVEAGHTGACCPLEVLPPPREVVNDRAEYACWHEALMMLVELLTNQLADHEVLPLTAPAQPWLRDEEPPHILRDLTKPWVFLTKPKRARRRRLDSAFGT